METRAIKNFEKLATSATRRAALEIAEEGIRAIRTAEVIGKWVKTGEGSVTIGEKSYPMRTGDKIVVAGVGKCAFEAAKALERILGEAITRGVALGVGTPPPLERITAVEGTHPLPSEANARGSAMLRGVLAGLGENDLVLFIISGGGSTLLCLPREEGCGDEGKIVSALMRSGAAIQEMNTVRKHLPSQARGGYLAQQAYPARVASLIFSDVAGDDVQFIASGPTVKDATSVRDAEMILEKYGLRAACGGERCGLVETPKDEKYFEKIQNIVAVSNDIALRAMADAAKQRGFAPDSRSGALVGEAREAGEKIARALHAGKSRCALLYGGETTVTVKGAGTGGRNMELALSALRFLERGEVVLSLASDGRDNSDYAGALCDIMTGEHAEALGRAPGEYLAANDSYVFFREVGDFLSTGITGSNVSDLVIALKE
ncbi:MAG: DUF4147 domain-containing protein [Candidatus Liptonbacteria bacterium]|nr:DUF4147 domain-containing protein [Candidatus Liptonbacteria bacterium]